MTDPNPLPAPSPHPAVQSLKSPPSQATRDRVIELLTQHYANDGIQLDEFERRTTAVFAATSADELHALVADVGTTALPAIVPDHWRVSAIFSSNEQQSAMAVARYLEIVAIFGNAELDLRDAIFVDGVTTIEIRATLGNVEITLPADVRVEMAGASLLGSFTSYAPTAQTPTTRVVRIVGRSVLANVEVTTAAPRFPAAPGTSGTPGTSSAVVAPR